jgi:hypothetical protein
MITILVLKSVYSFTQTLGANPVLLFPVRSSECARFLPWRVQIEKIWFYPLERRNIPEPIVWIWADSLCSSKFHDYVTLDAVCRGKNLKGKEAGQTVTVALVLPLPTLTCSAVNNFQHEPFIPQMNLNAPPVPARAPTVLWDRDTCCQHSAGWL